MESEKQRDELARNCANSMIHVNYTAGGTNAVASYVIRFEPPGMSDCATALAGPTRYDDEAEARRQQRLLSDAVTKRVRKAIDDSHQQCPAPTPINETMLRSCVTWLSRKRDQTSDRVEQEMASMLLRHLEFLNLILNGEEAEALKAVYDRAYAKGAADQLRSSIEQTNSYINNSSYENDYGFYCADDVRKQLRNTEPLKPNE